MNRRLALEWIAAEVFGKVKNRMGGSGSLLDSCCGEERGRVEGWREEAGVFRKGTEGATWGEKIEKKGRK